MSVEGKRFSFSIFRGFRARELKKPLASLPKVEIIPNEQIKVGRCVQGVDRDTGNSFGGLYMGKNDDGTYNVLGYSGDSHKVIDQLTVVTDVSFAQMPKIRDFINDQRALLAKQATEPKT